MTVIFQSSLNQRTKYFNNKFEGNLELFPFDHSGVCCRESHPKVVSLFESCFSDNKKGSSYDVVYYSRMHAFREFPA